jgi:hypothetical protein
MTLIHLLLKKEIYGKKQFSQKDKGVPPFELGRACQEGGNITIDYQSGRKKYDLQDGNQKKDFGGPWKKFIRIESE